MATVLAVSAEEVLPELASYGPVMTPVEVAQVMGVNRQHLVTLMRAGKFPGFRFGGAWRVRRAEVQDVLTGRWRPPGGEDDEDTDTED